ncbi:MAG: UDP-glucose 4-epimerase GalE [Candidatus Shapirobacteria bacterium]|nr:UDP-glucose 4-epimerase GalE [Candidatus Shapirobacteria bacterium]
MILIVGGAGYIGSHINKELNKQGFETVVFDNLASGRKELVKWGELIIGDLGNIEEIRNVFKKYKIDAVFHFAAFKAVGESVTNPQKYYKNNICNTLNLLEVMLENDVKKFIFSSSAAVFGSPQYMPIDEKHPQNPINPYGETKLIMEHVLRDYSKAYGLKYVSLRYFNACGADLESEVGEWPGSSANLIPMVLDAAIGRREDIKIFGTDYPTKDGTCIRDYIHVTDLAVAHILAFEYLNNGGESDCFNLGNGRGFSVKEVVDMAKEVTKIDFKVVESDKREGDPAVLVADSAKAQKVLGWKSEYADLKTIIESAWSWHLKKS